MGYNIDDYIDFNDFLKEVYEVEGIGIGMEINDGYITHLIPHYPYTEPMFILSENENQYTVSIKAQKIVNERLIPFIEMNLKRPIFSIVAMPGSY